LTKIRDEAGGEESDIRAGFYHDELFTGSGGLRDHQKGT